MLGFTGKTTQGEKITFGFNDIRHIVKDADLVILDRPKDVLVKFSTIEVDNFGKEVGGSSYPIAGRLGFH
jgi:hypothetical protein